MGRGWLPGTYYPLTKKAKVGKMTCWSRTYFFVPPRYTRYILKIVFSVKDPKRPFSRWEKTGLSENHIIYRHDIEKVI